MKSILRKIAFYLRNIADRKSLSFMFGNFLEIISRRVSFSVLNRAVNERALREVLRKRTNRRALGSDSISSVYDEDYESEWGKIDYRGKGCS